MTISAEDREKLTPEELAAMEELEQEEAERDEEDDEYEGDEADNEGDEEDAGDDDQGDDDDADSGEDEADAGDQDDDQAADDQGADGSQEEPAPLLRADLPDNINEQLSDIETKRAELDQQFDDGELDSAEWRKAVRELDQQEDQIRQQQFKAQLAAEMQAEQQRNAWIKTVNGFLDENPSYRKSKLMYSNLDTVVKEIASDPANESLSGRAILDKAHARVMEELGITPAEPDTGKQQRRGSKQKQEIPPTLGKVPAADATEFNNTKFARLERVLDRNPERYEAELAKLSDADREEWLATQ